jgi:multidrug efflux pump subunit AcrA (membrane-fusion protein)
VRQGDRDPVGTTMATTSPELETASTEWDDVRRLLDRVAELVEQCDSLEEFHARTLQHLVEIVADDGARWWIAGEGGFRLGAAVDGNGRATVLGTDTGILDAALFDEVVRARGALRMRSPVDEGAGEPDGSVSVLCPVVVADEAVAILDVRQSPGVSAAVRRSTVQVVEAVAELAGDFHRERLVRTLRGERRDWLAYRDLCRLIHGRGGERETATAVANELRTFLGCSRVTVLSLAGRRAAVLAISGAATFERRSNAVRELERLVAVSARAETSVEHVDGRTEDRAPQVEDRLRTYLDVSAARYVLLRMLAEEGAKGADPSFAIVVEQYDVVGVEGLAERFERVVPDVSRALLGARGDWWRRSRSTSFVWGGVGLFLAIAAAVLVLVPADFTVGARGIVEPAVRRRVYAPRVGFVRRLDVAYGRDVAAGDVLLELHDPDLELRARELEGEIQTVSQRIAAAETARLTGRTTPDRTALDTTSDLEELKKNLANLQQRQAIVEGERNRLTVQSPVAGRVSTWDLEHRLLTRPVEFGAHLLTVDALEGPWRLELEIPDGDVGHVAEALRAGESLRVEYAFATEPETLRRANLATLPRTTELDRDGRAIVRAAVALPRGDVKGARPGATVMARVHCGRRSLGYVWFHEVWEAVWTYWYR